MHESAYACQSAEGQAYFRFCLIIFRGGSLVDVVFRCVVRAKCVHFHMTVRTVLSSCFLEQITTIRLLHLGRISKMHIFQSPHPVRSLVSDPRQI